VLAVQPPLTEDDVRNAAARVAGRRTEETRGGLAEHAGLPTHARSSTCSMARSGTPTSYGMRSATTWWRAWDPPTPTLVADDTQAIKKGSKGHRLYDWAMHAVRMKGQCPAAGLATRC